MVQRVTLVSDFYTLNRFWGEGAGGSGGHSMHPKGFSGRIKNAGGDLEELTARILTFF